MQTLSYKDYEGTAELDMERGVCRGKLLFIDDLITYESDSPKSLQAEFEAAVDDYIETCAELGRQPKKPLKGMFNVRIPPALHKAAVLKSKEQDCSLNEVVVQALEAFVCAETHVNHNHTTVNVKVEMPPEHLQTLASSTSTVTKWEQVYGTTH